LKALTLFLSKIPSMTSIFDLPEPLLIVMNWGS
jgi:hypothetical protein